MLGNTSGTNFWLLLVTRVIQQAKVIYSIFLSVVFLSTPGMTHKKIVKSGEEQVEEASNGVNLLQSIVYLKKINF